MLLLLKVIRAPLHWFTVQQFWLWFIVPLGLPAITLAHAAGLSMTMAFYTTFASDSEILAEQKVPQEEKIICEGARLLATFILLFLGFVISLFMS
jgi:formate hydrogenlyase subunit 3/multisubunit Na+/H+ antiporter MnhD subunit